MSDKFEKCEKFIFISDLLYIKTLYTLSATTLYIYGHNLYISATTFILLIKKKRKFFYLKN